MKRAIPGFLYSILLASGGGVFAERNLEDLTILHQAHPRVFFFRSAESAARRNTNYEAWDTEFSRLMGIMGKCLEEEISPTELRNPEFFSRFKQRHPQQVVLLHFNGRARDPRYHTEHYFPGHWIYRKAVRLVTDVPAESGETEIRVRNARVFRVGIGRFGNSNDDIGLFGITSDGKHDWNHCEQVQLMSVDTNANTIRVRRGCYGTEPLVFKAGNARAAAHQVSGPWGKDNHLLWLYNFSVLCPKDAHGRTCADALVNDLVGWFGRGGKLAALDGVEFDVMLNETHGDTDGDGEMDDGMVDDLNQSGIGMVEFARKLRERMGDTFIIQGDGALGPGGVRSQRAFGLLNGIESEGFPNLNDWEMVDWSGGLNRHNFWQANARPPAFNYINHKWNQPVPGEPGKTVSPHVPFARHRLVFAAAQFTDAAICYSFPPERGSDGLIGVWDEFWCGTERKLGWLGKPLGDTVHLATAKTDLSRGAGSPAGTSLAQRIGGRVKVNADGDGGLSLPRFDQEADGSAPRPYQNSIKRRTDRRAVPTKIRSRGGQLGGLTLSPKDASASEVAFSIQDIPVNGDDLVVQVAMKAAPRRGYPKEMARFVGVTAASGATVLNQHSQRADTDDGVTGKAVSFRPSLHTTMTWVNHRTFASFFYFRDLKAKSVNLAFHVEGSEPVTLQKITAHAHPDATYRVFENGLVLANPGLKPYTFDLRAISPGRRYRHLQGTAGQDIETNNGAPVGDTVTLGERDALFLVRGPQPSE